MCLGRAVSLSTSSQEPDVVIAPIGWEIVVIGWMTSCSSLWSLGLSLALSAHAIPHAMHSHSAPGSVSQRFNGV